MRFPKPCLRGFPFALDLLKPACSQAGPQRQGQRKLPADIAYASIGTLSREAREKLAAVRPLTLGQASQIPGVSQADLTALLMWLELQQRRDASAASLASNANAR